MGRRISKDVDGGVEGFLRHETGDLVDRKMTLSLRTHREAPPSTRKTTTMAKQTSIHLRPCKQSSEIHNKRERLSTMCAPTFRLSTNGGVPYLHSRERRSQISALVKEKTGRKMQAKAEPLREGVVVIKEDTTMEELQELGKRFQERFGVTPVQIAIHKDEGHWQGKYGNRTSMPI